MPTGGQKPNLSLFDLHLSSHKFRMAANIAHPHKQQISYSSANIPRTFQKKNKFRQLPDQPTVTLNANFKRNEPIFLI
jgi:hypothetical protein